MEENKFTKINNMNNISEILNSIEWAEGNIASAYFKRFEYAYAYVWSWDGDYIIEVLKPNGCFSYGPSALSSIKAEKLSNGNTNLLLRSMSQDHDDQMPYSSLEGSIINIFKVQDFIGEDGKKIVEMEARNGIVYQKYDLIDFLQWKKANSSN